MTKRTQPLWGYGLDIHASIKDIEVTPKKSTKTERRTQFQKNLFSAINNKDYDILPAMISDNLFVGVNKSELHTLIFKKYDEQLFNIFKPYFDKDIFWQQIYMYAEREHADDKLLQYLFDEALSFAEDEESRQNLLVQIASQHFTDTRPLPQQIKRKALESGREIFGRCVGKNATHHLVVDIFGHVLQHAREGEWSKADILMKDMENASWDKVFLHALKMESDFFIGLNGDPQFLSVFSGAFERYPFLHDYYHQALETSKDHLVAGQEMLDTYLPAGTPFDKSPFWDIFVQHQKWSKGSLNSQTLQNGSARTLNIDIEGAGTHQEKMMMITDWARAKRQFPLHPDRYLYDDVLDDLIASDIVPKVPKRYRRCLTEAILCAEPSAFLKLAYHNMPDIIQQACQHDDVLFDILTRVEFDGFKTLVELDPSLKDRHIGKLNIANIWARHHYVYTKAMAQQMIRLHQGWFEEDGALWEVFLSYGLQEQQKNDLEKNMLKRRLRQDDGEAGRKIRSRSKKTRRM